MRENPDFLRNLREILILAEYHGDIILATPGQPDDVERNADVYSLFFACKIGLCGTIWQTHFSVAIAKGSRENVDALSPHYSQFSGPKVALGGVVRAIWYARIEPNLDQLTIAQTTSTFGKGSYIVVRKGITKRFFGCVEQILPVDESNRSFDGRF